MCSPGLLSLVIPFAAWIRGVPYITLVRMAANLGIGVLVGTIPIFGDIFDIVWKANRRNYLLLQPPPGEPRAHTWRTGHFCLMLAGGIALVFAIPLVLADLVRRRGSCTIESLARPLTDPLNPRYNRERTSGRSAAW